MASFAEYKNAYENNWADLEIRANRLQEARNQANRLLHGKPTYQQIESKTGVPWWFVGLCHYRKSNFNFDTYLGNGQSLARVTTIVPKGRGPFTGPDAFINGALDALRLEGFIGANDWGIARALYRLEEFNGYGYHVRLSPWGRDQVSWRMGHRWRPRSSRRAVFRPSTMKSTAFTIPAPAIS